MVPFDISSTAVSSHMNARQQPAGYREDMVSSQLSQMLIGRVGSAHTLIGIYAGSRSNLLRWHRSNRCCLLLRSRLDPLPSVRYDTIGLLDRYPPLVVALWTASSVSCYSLSVHKAQSPLR